MNPMIDRLESITARYEDVYKRQHPDELALIRKVANACKRADKGFGIIGPLPLIAEFKNDIDLLISAIDVNILRDGLKQYVKGYQDIIK